MRGERLLQTIVAEAHTVGNQREQIRQQRAHEAELESQLEDTGILLQQQIDLAGIQLHEIEQQRLRIDDFVRMNNNQRGMIETAAKIETDLQTRIRNLVDNQRENDEVIDKLEDTVNDQARNIIDLESTLLAARQQIINLQEIGRAHV